MEQQAYLIRSKDAYNFYHVYTCGSCRRQVDAIIVKYCPHCGSKFIGVIEKTG